jgi:hypothetical protein
MQKTIIIATAATLGVLLLVLGTLQIKSNEKLSREQVKEFKVENAKRNYVMCLDVSYQLYDQNWESNCKLLGRGEECGLPISTSEDLNSLKAREDETCIELYKLELNNI